MRMLKKIIKRIGNNKAEIWGYSMLGMYIR